MRYRAFFSYARADDRIANWLHRQLDGYRTPKPLVGSEGELGPVPAKLHPIFRDRTDLESGGHVDRALQDALEESETLIVLCTPTSAKSRWVNHEVETFLKLGREAAIFPVIAAGVPDSGDPDTECFPPALRGKGLLAADLREIKLPTGQLIGDGREGGRLKLIAGLLGVGLDQLLKREQARQRLALAALSFSALVFAAVASAAVVQTFASNRNAAIALANEQRALRGEANAKANAEAERAARAEAEQRTRERDAEALRAIANAREAEHQEGIASERARQARSTLHRFFATQAWTKIESGDYVSAGRYALAGMQLSPENAGIYRSVLGSALQYAVDSPPPLLHDGPIESVLFSPDGRSILTASKDGSAKVWSPDGELLAIAPRRRSAIEAVAFSPDGQSFFTVDSDNTTSVVETRTGRPLASFDAPYNPRFAAFSAGGASLFSVGEFVAPTLRNTADGQLIAVLKGRQEGIDGAAFSRDGSRLLTTSWWDQTVRVWNASDGEPVSTIREVRPRSAQFYSDAEFLVTSGDSNNANVWRSADGARVRSLSGHESVVNGVAVSPNGRVIATFSNDQTTRLWSATDGALLYILRGHSGSVTEAVFSNDSERLLTLSGDGSAKLWDVGSGQTLASLANGGGVMTRAAFSSDDRQIVIAGRDGTARVWRVADLISVALGRVEAISAEPLPAQSSRPFQASIGSATLNEGRSFVLIRNSRDGRERLRFRASTDNLVDVKISSNDRRVVTVDALGAAKLWSLDLNGALEPREVATLGAATEKVELAEFSPTGDLVATANRRGEVNLHSAETGELRYMLRSHLNRIESLHFSVEGSRIVTSSWDGTAKVWSAIDGGLVATLTGHYGYVRSASFSNDSTRIVTSGDDKSVRIWDASDGRLLATNRFSEAVFVPVFMENDQAVAFARAPPWGKKSWYSWDVSRVTLPWRSIARIACLRILGAKNRRFSQAEIDADPLLRAEWQKSDRDVCEGIPGVPSIAELSTIAGLLH
jgi:WD40 repeat protein